MKKIILFDIDFTLIDSLYLRDIVSKRLILKIGVDDVRLFDSFQSSYTSSLKSSTDFHPGKYCKILANRFSADYRNLIKTFYSEKDHYIKSVYKDVAPELLKLKNIYSLGIFTEGFVKFQTAKLSLSDILPYFSKKYIYIYRRKMTKGSLKKLPKNCVVVDDRKEIVEELYKHNIDSVWLNRRSNEVLKNIPTIKSLHYLPLALKSFT